MQKIYNISLKQKIRKIMRKNDFCSDLSAYALIGLIIVIAIIPYLITEVRDWLYCGYLDIYNWNYRRKRERRLSCLM